MSYAHVRDRVDSSLPMLPGHSCKAQALCTSLTMNGAALQPSLKQEGRGFWGLSFTGRFSKHAAGNADTPHEGHQPKVPGRQFG